MLLAPGRPYRALVGEHVLAPLVAPRLTAPAVCHVPHPWLRVLLAAEGFVRAWPAIRGALGARLPFPRPAQLAHSVDHVWVSVHLAGNLHHTESFWPQSRLVDGRRTRREPRSLGRKELNQPQTELRYPDLLLYQCIRAAVFAQHTWDSEQLFHTVWQAQISAV